MAFEEMNADYLLAMREEHGNIGPVLASKGAESTHGSRAER